MTISHLILFPGFFTGKITPSVALFNAAQKIENDGNFEDALTNYETALTAVTKTRLSNRFRLKILDKIKVLHTVIQYRKTIFAFPQ